MQVIFLFLVTFITCIFVWWSCAASRVTLNYKQPGNSNTTSLPDKYVIFSAAIPNELSSKMKRKRLHHFLFFLPLTSLAWRRLNYTPIIVITGTRRYWDNNTLLRIVRRECEKVGATIVFLETQTDFEITMSQVARIYSSAFPFFQNKTAYILTSDADIWPIHRYLFEPPCGRQCKTKVVAYNNACCGYLGNNKDMAHYPISYIGMTKNTWKDVMELRNVTINSAEDIIKHLEKNNYNLKGEDGRRGTKLWYVDQHMISTKLYAYLKSQNSGPFISILPHIGVRQRIRKVRFVVPNKLDGKVDAHLPINEYNTTSVWEDIRPLLEKLVTTEELYSCDNYYREFLENLY